jgi:exodeoxyribonuclease VII large subunit
MNERRQTFKHLSQLLVKPDALIQSAANRLSSETRALKQTTPIIFNERRSNLSRLSQLLESYSYERVLERGFSLVTDSNQKPITSATELSVGNEVIVRLKDGKVGMTVTGSELPKPNPKKASPKPPDARQRSLL